MNVQDENKSLKQRIAELEELAKEEQEFPQDGDKYWYVGATGRIFNSEWDGFASTEGVLEIDNVYKTKQEAEFAVEKLKIEAELRKYSRPFERGSLNFIMCFDVEENKLYSETRRFMNQGSLYFDWGQVVRAIETVGKERIKKYIFGVED